MKLGYLFSLYEVLSSTCSLSGNCSKRSVQRKRRKCLQWFLSECAFQDKQPIDCMTFLNTSIYGAYAGRISFQPTYSFRVGGGYFLQPLSRGWCKWESIVSGLVQNWIFKLIQLFFILFFLLLLMCPCASSPVTRCVSLEFASPRRRQTLYSSEKSLCLNESNWYDRST